MKSMHDDHVVQSKRSHLALYKLTEAHRSSSTRGRFQSDDYSITSSPSSIASSPSSQGSPPVQKTRTGTISAPKTERKAPSSKASGMETPTSRKTNNRSVATERKLPVKDSTNQRTRPAPKKKKKATAAPAVMRAFKPGCEFPKNSKGGPCG